MSDAPVPANEEIEVTPSGTANPPESPAEREARESGTDEPDTEDTDPDE